MKLRFARFALFFIRRELLKKNAIVPPFYAIKMSVLGRALCRPLEIDTRVCARVSISPGRRQ